MVRHCPRCSYRSMVSYRGKVEGVLTIVPELTDGTILRIYECDLCHYTEIREDLNKHLLALRYLCKFGQPLGQGYNFLVEHNLVDNSATISLRTPSKELLGEQRIADVTTARLERVANAIAALV